MTPDDLRALSTSTVTRTEFADAFRSLAEAQRQALSTTVQSIFKSTRKLDRELRSDDYEWSSSEILQVELQIDQARLAVLACCSWSDVRKIKLEDFADREGVESARRILLDRRPDWADDWVAQELQFGMFPLSSQIEWKDIRELMQAGVIRKPAGPGYHRLMVEFALQNFDPDQMADLIDTDIWGLFSFDTRAFDGVPDPKKLDREEWRQWPRNLDEHTLLYMAPDFWPRLLYDLAQTGRIDRLRLIEATVSAFWHEFRRPAQVGFLRFLAILDPTPDEIAALEAKFRELLSNAQPPVVSMALAKLADLHRAGGLDSRSFLKSVKSAVRISSKAQPKSALALIGLVTQSNLKLLPLAVKTVIPALDHTVAEIQEQAVKLLEKWKGTTETLDLSCLRDVVPHVFATFRARVEQLAGGGEPEAESRTARSTPATLNTTDPFSSRRPDVSRRFADLPESIRTMTCLNRLEQALDAVSLPPAFDPDPVRCPALSTIERIEPICDADELVDSVLHLFEKFDRAEEFERVLDGLMRFGNQKIAGFEAKTESLRKRVHNNDPSNFRDSDRNFRAYLVDFVRLISTWVEEVFRKDDLRFDFSTPIFDTYNVRLRQLIDRWNVGEANGLLSLPTHRGGWIDPRVFVARLKTMQSGGQVPDSADFVFGLLRLAPDFREAALDAAGDLPSDHGRILRYALGGDNRQMDVDQKMSLEWLAAGRSRQPRGTLDALLCLGIDNDMPDGITPAIFRLVLHPQLLAEQPKTLFERRMIAQQSLSPLCIKVTPGKFSKVNGTEHPTIALAALLNPRVEWTPRHHPELEELIVSTWPSNPDAALAFACDSLNSWNFQDGRFGDVSGYLTPLFNPDRGWSPIGRLAIWFALLSRNEKERGMAIDLLIEGIADGRAGTQELAEPLLQISEGEGVRPKRLIEGLREVTRTSLLAERIVASILDDLIASWKAIPRDGHYVLEFELELLTSLGQSLSEPARSVLAAAKGTGKAAKLAKKLCELKPDPNSTAMRETVLLAAEGRLARAERIHRYIERGGN